MRTTGLGRSAVRPFYNLLSLQNRGAGHPIWLPLCWSRGARRGRVSRFLAFVDLLVLSDGGARATGRRGNEQPEETSVREEARPAPGLGFFLPTPGESIASMVVAPELSVVVLTHNSFRDKSGCIRHTLAALCRQRAVSFEVVVVDNGSTQADQRRLRALCSKPPWASMNIAPIEADLPIGAARNLGAKVARSDLVVFLDDDAILLDEGALARVKEVAGGASHGYGAQRLWTPPHPWFSGHQGRLLSCLQREDIRPLLEALGGPPFEVPQGCLAFDYSFPGHFGFVWRELFHAVGGFPPDFVGYGFEDNAFGLLCYMQSRLFGWLGELRVAHVSHHRPVRYEGEHHRNQRRYEGFLADRGLRGFNIDLLLGGYADTPENRVLLPL